MTSPALDDPQVTEAMPDGPPPGWRGPIMPVNIASGDNRLFPLDGDEVPHRPLPLPLNAQYALDDHHKGSVVIGLITRMWVQDGAVWGEGPFDLTDPTAADWAMRMGRGMAGWVSADLSDIAVTEVALDADGNEITSEQLRALYNALAEETGPVADPVASWQYRFDQWKIMGATLVSGPAFEGAKILPAYDVPALTAAAESDDTETEHTGAMIALVPAAEDAARLAVEGGETVDELHLTLAYLGEAAEWTPEQIDAVHTAVAELAPSGPVLGEVWGHATFNPNSPDKDPCAVYLIQADGLSDFRQAIVGAMLDTGGPMPEQHDTFVPHVTAGYGLPAAELVETGPIRFDRIRIAFAGTYEDIPLEPVTTALTAAAVVYDHRDFELPEPDEPTRLTITDDGRVFGHLAEWGSCHVGFADICVTPPTSAFDYAFFHQGTIRTDDGPIAVGKITISRDRDRGGHAGLHLGLRAAAEHYDNSCTAVAVVRCRDGAVGPWLSGRILPGVDEDRIEELRRSGISGDWRGVRRNSDALELIAVLAVNSPGFPIVARTRALAAAGVRSLIAAGMLRRGSRGPRVLDLDDVLRTRRIAHAAGRIRAGRIRNVATRMAALTKGVR
ncbi:2'-5' RNA ligase family protein [Nocardia abscessus]|uniref:2'-5' RNA ligase family protein n=1 Tax=Nocardia abscessus TaxID=120957 RepID=UPI0024543601|nr:2'-5' RNA ligase family protein [Nocardia abscessus]